MATEVSTISNIGGDKYLTLAGTQLTFSDWREELLGEHVLQTFCDVWVLTRVRPFLAIDEKRFRTRIAEMTGAPFVVLSGATLWQNVSLEDLRTRLLTSLGGPGLAASPSATSEYLVEGEANPQAHLCQRWNEMLRFGTHPFVAMQTHYIAVEPGRIFQRKAGELIVEDKHTRPQSDHFDFSKLARLASEFHVAHLDRPAKEKAELATMLDAIFAENEAALIAVERHHAEADRSGPRFTDPPARLTRYGRLVHREGVRLVETSFALLHYEKALHEFDTLKRATAEGNLERSYLYGVYCVVAVAASVEAIANRLWYDEKGSYPGMDGGTAVGRMMGAARRLAANQGKTFNTMGTSEPEYRSMERVRLLRNSFIHATEGGAAVDPHTLLSVQVVDVNEQSCRQFLLHLRNLVAFVFDQLEWLSRPINTRPNVSWLGDIEVP